MSTDSPLNSASVPDRNERLEAVIADCIRAFDGGNIPDRAQWLQQYPEFATELKQFFTQREHLNRLADPIRDFSQDLFQAVGPGQKVSYIGNYELLEEVARGGMGVVYKARQTTLGRIVAVKMILTGRLANEQDVQRFQSEAQAAASLQHPNIVAIHEVGQHEGWHYFSMDYVEGRDLSAILRENLPTAKKAAHIIRQIAQAIHYAHLQGILHRDLKPSNILIDQHEQVRITDFGLAMRVEDDRGLTQTGQILGTPSYMPPEQAQCNRGLIGPTSDVYALGAVLYECLSGRPPFRADSVVQTLEQVIHTEAVSPRTLNASIPRDLETVCLKCLEKEPHRRYATAQLLADDLGRFVRGEPVLALPISRVARSRRWCRRNPTIAGLVVISALSLALGTAVSTYFAIQEAEQSQRAELKTAEALTEKQLALQAKSAAEKARSELAKAFWELQVEQAHSSTLSVNVAELEARSVQLNESINSGSTKLRLGEEKLFDTYMQLSRSAWRADNIELANYYLNECPQRLRDNIWHDLKRKCYPNVLTLNGQRLAKFSADGKWLAAVAKDAVKIWDVSTQESTQSFEVDARSAAAIAINHDGTLLACGQKDQVIVWDVSQHVIVARLMGHQAPLTDVAFSADQKYLATASVEWSSNMGNSGEGIVWELPSFKMVGSLPATRYVVFSPDGKWLATAQQKGIPLQVGITIWNTANFDSPAFTINGIYGKPCFHPTSKELAAPSGMYVDFWDIESQKVIRQFTGEVRPDHIAYSPDGKRFAYSGETAGFADRPHAYRAITWNTITRETERTLPWFTSNPADLAFSPDGKYLATADAEAIKLWDVTPPPDPTTAILSDIVDMDVGQFDWPQWGGSRSRINTPAGKNIPTTWDVGPIEQQSDFQKADKHRLEPRQPVGSKNIKWVVPLGSETYGNPVVANGKIILGTNNGAGYLQRYAPDVDLGVLLCFEEATGKFLWQHSNEKLPTGRVHDWPNQGVCSTPVADGERIWYVSNRGEVVCLDALGFYDDEDDGPTQAEWMTIFSVDALLHGQLMSYPRSWSDLPELIRSEFSRLGLDTPLQIEIKRDSIQKIWTLDEVVFKNGTVVERKARFVMRLEGNQFKVLEITSDGSQPTELFSVDDRLLPNHGTPRVAYSIQDELLKHEIQLLDQPAPFTIEEGKSWEFSGSLNGVEQQFVAVLENAKLIIRKRQHPSDKQEADVIWKFNMMQELGVSQHNMANCSMLSVDGVLFVCTSNGVDEGHLNLPAPDAPSFIALDRETGRVLWTDNSPGGNVMHAQWGSPSYGVFNGQPQVIFAGGDGWVYSFDPRGDGHGGSRLLWKFDGNPKTSKYALGGSATRNQIIAFPAIYDGLVYIAMGEDPEHGEGDGHLWCIDPTKRLDGGDVSDELAVDLTGNAIPPRRLQAVDVRLGERAIPNPNSAVVWHYSHQDLNQDGEFGFEEVFHRSLSTPVIKDDVLYIGDFSGVFHCLNAKTGKAYWTYDLFAACWSSALLVDGKVYIADEDGDIAIFRHSADPRIAMTPVQTQDNRIEFAPLNSRWEGQIISECRMGTAIYMTPIVANNVLYVATRNRLYAIAESAAEKP